MVSYSGLVAKAGVDPAIHKLCSDVKDYSGCVDSHSGNIKTKFKVNDVPNKCKQGYAYVGAGNCQQVTCVNAQGWGMANSDEPLIAGKSNWKCKSKLVIGWMNSGRGQLRLGAVGKAIYDPLCPPREPEIGWNSSCETAPENWHEILQAEQDAYRRRCGQVIRDYDCSYNKYLEANPSIKAWADANPEMARKERLRLKSDD